MKLSFEKYAKVRKDCASGGKLNDLAIEHDLPQSVIKAILTSRSFDDAAAACLEITEPRNRRKNSGRKLRKPTPEIKISKRDSEILALRREGLTLEEIGERFEITRERVRQIIVKFAKDEVFPTRLEVRQEQILNEKKALRLEITANWLRFKKMTMKELADEYGISVHALGKVINKVQYAYLRGNQKSHISQVWTSEMCLDVLRQAATYAFPLTVLEYRKLVNSGTINGPTLPIFISRFGSWMEACAKAGVETGNPVREYDTTWSDSDLILMVRRFMWETRDAGWSVENYEKWRSNQDPAVASSGLLRLRLGQWSEMRVLALDFEAQEYDMSIFEDMDNDEF
jgi:predicted DNA-binding protein YlxM (UPF0122 family)